MLISLRSPPPCCLTQLPSPPLLAPPSATASRLRSKSPLAATNPLKKRTRRRSIPPAGGSSTPSRRWFNVGGAKRGWFAGGGGSAGWILYSGGGGGEVNSSNQQKFLRIMSSRHLFSSCAHSSSAGAKLERELLCPRTTVYPLGFPATLFLSTVLRTLRGLMHGVENLSVPGLRAMSQNILWSTTKVNEACAWPPHVT